MMRNRLFVYRSNKDEVTMPELAPSFQRSDVKVLQKDRVYDGFFKMDRLTLNHRQFSGEWTENV